MSFVDEAFSPDADLRILKRNSRIAAALGLVGGFVILFALAFSAWQVGELQRRKAALKQEVATLEISKQQLITQTKQLTTVLEAKRDTAELALEQIEQQKPQAAAATLAASIAAPVNALSPAEAKRLSVGRIYFQVRSDAQNASFRDCVKPLVAAGYRVPSAEHVTVGPKRNELRYFHPEEKNAALSLQGQLQACLQQPVALSLASYSGVNPLHFEVWMAPPATN